MVKQQKLSNKQKTAIREYLAASGRLGSEVRRAQAVLLVNDEADAVLIRNFTRFSKRQAFALRKAYLAHGIGVFTDHRKSNRPRVLTGTERAHVIATLKTKQPKAVVPGCTAEHWTTGLLGVYITKLTGKQYKSKTSERLLFREAKLTFHLPGKQYENADPAAKAQWEKEKRPLLKKHWSDKDTVILCEDEMVLTSRTTVQKVWLPKGEYPPVIETNNTRRRKNFYGFLNLKTGQQHAFVTEKQNMGVTADVLGKVRELYSGKKLVIFWDNCGWHRGSKVAEWIEQDGNTETVHFPPYTPQLNPQEHVWKAGRKAVTHNRYVGERLEEVTEQLKDYITGRTFAYSLLGLSCGAG